MKRFQKVNKGVLYALLCVVTLSSCGEYGSCDGMILTDTKTGQRYKLTHYNGRLYYLEAEVVKIYDGDTTIVFEAK